jgi:NADPH:quinone reductase-like Zn-dependent oxidoreductase
VAGSQLAKRVLVTGATGGVGQYAVQLASLSGANVTAFVRDVDKSSVQLRTFGADTVVDALEGRFDLVIDAVGGTSFAAAIEHIAPAGVVINVATDPADEMVAFRAAHYDRAAGATIYTFNLLDELRRMEAARDLTRLVTLLAQRKLVAPVELEADWHNVAQAIDALLKRRISGKAVLHLHRQ